jgi:hypothetical protein
MVTVVGFCAQPAANRCTVRLSMTANMLLLPLLQARQLPHQLQGLLEGDVLRLRHSSRCGCCTTLRVCSPR